MTPAEAAKAVLNTDEFVIREGKVVLDVSVNEEPVDDATQALIDNYEPPASTDPADYKLNKVQFRTMLAVLDIQISSLEAAIKAMNLESTLEHNAIVRLYHSDWFNYDDALLQSVRAQIGMSEEDLTTAWLQAKEF